MSSYSKYIFACISILLGFVPVVSFAAGIFFDAQKDIFSPSEDFLVGVYLDASGASANALEGSVLYPDDLLELKEVRDGNSAVNFWVEKPHSVVSGSVVFSGITAGEFSGSKNILFSAIFHTKKAGNGSIGFQNIHVLQNDGLGSAVSLQGIPFAFSILSTATASSSEDISIQDNVPPENFKPFVGNDPAIFDGKYFLVFSAQDKGSGIDHYEVREGIWGVYVVAESPYVLADQSLSKTLYVEAVDKKGNKTVAVLGAQNPSWWYQPYLIIAIILIVLIYFFRRIWLKPSK